MKTRIIKEFPRAVDSMGEEDIIKYLKVSSERAGRLYPVLVDKHGNVIDGLHRLSADEKWPKVTVESVETEEQRLIARLVSNVCRRNVPAKEKREMLGRLAEIYLNEGVKPKGIAERIMKRTGMSYRWVMKYLPGRYKADPDKGKRSKLPNLTNVKVARRATREDLLKELLTPPQRNGVLEIKRYANTHFVNVIVEKSFYEEFEKTSSELGVSTENSMLKALEDYHEKMKKALALKKLEEKAAKQNEKRQNTA
jgi:hypothetical protein